MGWRGFLRSSVALGRKIERAEHAAQRRAEHETSRRRRELLAQYAHYERMEEQQRAAHDLAMYENYLTVLVSIHKECRSALDWRTVERDAPPPAPQYASPQERAAVTAVQSYQPAMLDKMLGRDAVKRQELVAEVEQARRRDAGEHERLVARHRDVLGRWQWSHDLSVAVNRGDPAGYATALEHLSPFSELEELGTTVHTATTSGQIEATVHVQDDEIIPDEERAMTAKGKLSVKKMPQGKYWELYQDHVCSCALRVAREVFALLPVQMVFVHTTTRMLNPRTGHQEQQPVLSVAFARETLARLNFDAIDPSESMKNFVHNTSFKKTKGFAAVELVRPGALMHPP